MATPFDLTTPYTNALDTNINMPGPQRAPDDMTALMTMMMPMLQQWQQSQASARQELPRQVQAVRSGGRVEPITGALQATTPLEAQREHEALWQGMFTPTSGRIAKERERFQTPEDQPTFTEQELMNPQQKIARSMGGGWEGLTPAERRVRLQQRAGQTPDYVDPLTGKVTGGAPVVEAGVPPPSSQTPEMRGSPPQQQAKPAARPAGSRGAPHPAEQAPPQSEFAQQQAEATRNMPTFLGMPMTTPTVPYRGQQIPAVPSGGFNMNQGILDEAERVRQLGLARQEANQPMWDAIAGFLAPPVQASPGYQPNAGFARQMPNFGARRDLAFNY